VLPPPATGAEGSVELGVFPLASVVSHSLGGGGGGGSSGIF
jgi:hypothetical protein